MKKFLSILTAAVGLTITAFANIGDTYQQSCARYGQSDKRSNGSAHWIIDNDNTVAETFAPNGRCDAIWYCRFGSAFTDEDLLNLIAFNVPSNQSFKEEPVNVGRFWHTPNLSRTVLLVVRDNHGRGRNPIELSIWTKGHGARLDAAKRAPASDQTVDVDGYSI